MTRTAAALLTAMLSIPALAAAQPGVEEPAPAGGEPAIAEEAPSEAVAPDAEPAVAAEPEVAPSEEASDEPQADEDYVEEEYDEEVFEGESFCGGGEESVVDLAYYEMQDGRLARARSMLVTALREGAVDEYQRGYALSTLAEIQLRMRQYGQAVVNYRKALRVDPDGVGAATRVGLATALYLRGAARSAYAEASGVRDDVCGDPYAMVACYGAQWIVAHTSRDAAERQEATDILGQIRADHPDLSEELDQVEGRLERRRSRAVPRS